MRVCVVHESLSVSPVKHLTDARVRWFVDVQSRLPSFTMPLSKLPTVLVQSVMHCLTTKEILLLARCCRFTLSCANAAFAWRDCPPLRIRLRGASSAAPTPLLRFTSLAVSCESADIDELLSVGSTGSVISELTLWGQLPSWFIDRCFPLGSACPALQHLTRLSVEDFSNKRLAHVVAVQPTLNSLCFLRPPRSLFLPQLQQSKRLTSLSLEYRTEPIFLCSLKDLRSLTRLRADVVFESPALFRMVCAALSSKLRHLTLVEGWGSIAPHDQEWATQMEAGWAAITKLETLVLVQCDCSPPIVFGAISRIPALRSLSLEFCAFKSDPLKSLLASAQSLQCQVICKAGSRFTHLQHQLLPSSRIQLRIQTEA